MNKFLIGIIALMGIAQVTTITNDGGGNVVQFATKYAAMRAAGDTIRIDGWCASSCTMSLGLVDTCVTPKAVLGFHSAYTPFLYFWHIRNQPATDYLWSTYPGPVQDWITQHGGLQPDIKILQGDDMLKIVKNCE